MSGRVVLSEKEKDAYYQLLENYVPPPPKLVGTCAGCGRGIPNGYLYVVTKWKSLDWGTGMKVNQPDEVWCRNCGADVEGTPKQRRKYSVPAPYVPEAASNALASPKRSLKETAIALYRVMVPGKGMGSKKIARLAEVEYTPTVKVLLKKLKEAGKVSFVEGRWVRG